MQLTLINNIKNTLLDLFKNFKFEPSKLKKIELAFSGGSDSSFLLHILWLLKDELKLDLHILYVEHNIRDKEISSTETEFIKKIAKEYNVNLHYKKIEENKIFEIADRKKRGIESVAREIRYDFFSEMKEKNSLDLIALAHHKDDNRETAFMRFLKNSWVSGLRGIPKIRGFYIRPILNIEKKEIIKFLDENKIKYLDDKSNYDEKYYRNYIRNNLIPYISIKNSDFNFILDNFIEKMEYIDDFIKKEADLIKIFPYYFGSYYIDFDIFKNLSVPIKIELIYRVYNRIFGDDEKIGFDFVKRIISLNEKYILAKDLEIEILNNKIIFSNNMLKFSPDFKFYSLELSDDIKNFNRGEVWFLKDRVQGKIFLRNYIEKDRINTTVGEKKLSDIFIDWKVPRFLRKKIPLVCDNSGIIAVIGRTFNYKNIIRKDHFLVEKKENFLYYIIYSL